MNDIKSVMVQTGMGELQAYRHLQDRRKAQALYTKERRRQRPQLSQEAANEALRLWQIARFIYMLHCVTYNACTNARLRLLFVNI